VSAWTRVRLSRVLREIDDRDHPDLEVLSVYRDLGVIPKASRDDNFNKTPEDLGAYKRVRVGDLVINKMKAWSGSLAISGYDGIVSGDYMVCAVTGLVDRRFLHHLLRSRPVFAQIAALSTGIRPSQWRLYWDDLRQIYVDLPLQGAQLAIADFLDAETAQADRIVECLEKANHLLDEWLASEIEATIWSGGEPLVPLMHLTPGDRQIQYGIVLPGPDVSDGVPIVKGGNVVTGRLSAAGLARTTREIEAGFARSRLRRNDIVFAIRGAVGACAMVPEEVEGANITQDVARVSPLRGVDPSYLLCALKSRTLQQQAESRILGATIRGINIRDLKRLRVPVPTPIAQQRKAEALARMQAHRDQVAARRQRQIDLLVERRQALITAAVTGQLKIPGFAT
jgi:type I restriction enzyme S subunit